MRGKVIAVLAIVGLLAFAQTLSAQDKEKKKRGPGGRVKSVDASASTITVTMGRKDATDKTYKVAKDAKVTIGDEAKTLADVKEGNFVALTVGEGEVVTAIRVIMRKKKDNT
jgi:hypothetical protein